jgi:ribonuclease HI
MKTMGVGAILIDEKGQVVAAMAKVIPHFRDPTVAEAVALWKAVNLCSDIGVSQVEFEGDSLEVVQAVNGESPCWKSYGH